MTSGMLTAVAFFMCIELSLDVRRSSRLDRKQLVEGILRIVLGLNRSQLVVVFSEDVSRDLIVLLCHVSTAKGHSR